MASMTVREFCDRHDACHDARDWADDTGWLDRPMADLWASGALRPAWQLWAFTRRGVATDRDLRLFACRCVRETPLADGRRVWDMLTDPLSRAAVEAAERFARGDATRDELAAARDAAWAAARDAAWSAAWNAAWAAAGDAQRGWMIELPVSFETEG